MEGGSYLQPLDNMPSFFQGISYNPVLGSTYITHQILTKSISSAVRGCVMGGQLFET